MGSGQSIFAEIVYYASETKIGLEFEAYSSASKSLLKSLEPIHNAAIRIATETFISSHIISISLDSGLKPLNYYREIKILNHLSKIYVNNNHPLHEII